MWVVVESDSRSWVQEVQYPITVGRALENAIVVEDTASSRQHCQVERDEEGQAWLRDLESRNGTRLNGRFVRKALLQQGDRIEIGATVITFMADDEAAARRASTEKPESLRSRVAAALGSEALARDALTGLASFPVVQGELQRELAQPGQAVVLIKLDLDYLGLLNDMFGMRAGDEIIRQVAQALRRTCEDHEHAGRLICARESGGKFALLYLGADAPLGRKLADAARAAVNERPLDGPLAQASLTLSAGVAENHAGTGPWEGLMRRAEAALAQAKRQGRDRVVVAAAEVPEAEPRASTIASALRETRSSGLWAASGLWDPRVARGTLPEGEGEPGSGRGFAPLMLTHGGQSILGLVAQALGSDLELDPLLDLILGVIGDTAGARRGYAMVREPSGGFSLRAAFDKDAPGSRRSSAVSQGIVREAERTRSAVLVQDALQDQRFSARESIVTEGARSVLTAPILWGEDVVGIIYLDDKSRPGAFGAPERDLLLACCRLIAGPIRRQVIHQARTRELYRAKAALARTADAEKQRARRYSHIIGRSAAMQRMFNLLDRLGETNHPVLIHGESGTGKELVASAIHYTGLRADGPFVAENCAAFSETLLEAELFGHVKGAFTGANDARVGLVEAAHGGTLFLDEIGEMSPSMQAKLLRVLQEGELRPVGGRDVRKVDVRLICASHRDLRDMVRRGAFREDLYYRVAVMTVEVPALRERMEDIPLLIDHFLARGAKELQRTVPSIGKEALTLLCHYDWPGNVRELENEIKKLLTLAADEVAPADLSPRLLGDSIDRPNSALRKLAINEGADAMLLMIERGKALADVIESIENELIERMLKATGGNRSETARRLGLSRPGLLKKMKRHGIE
ncbi:MAG: sigma 54-interacting transcriptional regulator [Planctomycetota bacterium]